MSDHPEFVESVHRQAKNARKMAYRMEEGLTANPCHGADH